MSCSPPNSQLREQVNNVHMIVSPLWHGPGNIHGFLRVENPTEKDGPLLKYQMRPPFLVWG